MKTLEQKLIKFKFVKISSFWYFWYIVLLGRGVYQRTEIESLFYKQLSIGQARSLLMELPNIWKVFLSNDKKTMYITLLNNINIYKLKLCD